MPNSFGAGDDDVKGPVRIPVCLRSAKMRKVCCGCRNGGDSSAVMRENPSQTQSEMKEVMSGIPRSNARVRPGGRNHPGTAVSALYSISAGGELVKPNNLAVIQI